jgi:hypothetical protein
MRSFFLAFCLLLVVAASYFFYLDRKLEPITNSPGVRLNATRFVPVDVAKKRKINLGYASFSIPESIRGDPFNIDSSGFVGIRPALVFCRPFSSRKGELAAYLREISSLAGEPIKNQFELEKLELAQQPFSVWQMLIIGKQKAAARAALLLLKSIDAGTATSVRILENDRLGLIVWSKAGERDQLMITDFKSGVSQGVLINSSTKNIDEVVSAIASDYEIHLMEANIDTIDDNSSLNRLIASAGIKTVANAKTSAVQEPFDEQRALKEIQAEIVRRRAERIKKDEGSGRENEPSQPSP